MSKRTRGKISTDGGASFGSAAFGGDALGGLDLGGLASGPAAESLPTKSAGDRGGSSSRGRVEVRREKAGRGGKTVTTLKAFTTGNSDADLKRLLKELKQVCACGGVCREREIELQGDLVDRMLEELAARGFQAVKAGG